VSLVLDDVHAGYGRVEIVHGVSLELDRSEIVAIIGPNGAGKTTLLRAVSAVVPVTRGRVVLDGRDLTGARVETVARAGVASVPEGRRLFAGLSVRDNLRLGGWRNRRRDLAPALDLFPPLAARLDRVAGSLSGGEQQMCAIGRALMSEPSYLLLDELTLGLAPVVIDDIFDRLPAIAGAGTGVLLVEQDAGAALDVAGRGYVLENGAVTVSGTAADLRDDARVRAAYLGI
jgi:branched-chain amino acid transport system ATP-binding protein